ncbi:hypothetical protein [Chitinophaga japonensis]|uniref:Uncharacterized protein n=1 Tax=Chitinophaga japonensis TaxID=104662 RepID=A0A562SZ65_CHIJA|nr:hypothetical protein [Chitinophaga japonensis]TWI86314.1 hypothetical protein LX66_3568 [Chitinophaga japonensis]
MKRKRKNYVGFQVVKRSPNGRPVHTYNSINEARIAENIRYYRLLAAIDNRKIINGHLFTFKSKSRPERQKPKKREDWEGEDGLFNIKGWAALAIPV